MSTKSSSTRRYSAGTKQAPAKSWHSVRENAINTSQSRAMDPNFTQIGPSSQSANQSSGSRQSGSRSSGSQPSRSRPSGSCRSGSSQSGSRPSGSRQNGSSRSTRPSSQRSSRSGTSKSEQKPCQRYRTESSARTRSALRSAASSSASTAAYKSGRTRRGRTDVFECTVTPSSDVEGQFVTTTKPVPREVARRYRSKADRATGVTATPPVPPNIIVPIEVKKYGSDAIVIRIFLMISFIAVTCLLAYPFFIYSNVYWKLPPDEYVESGSQIILISMAIISGFSFLQFFTLLVTSVLEASEVSPPDGKRTGIAVCELVLAIMFVVGSWIMALVCFLSAVLIGYHRYNWYLADYDEEDVEDIGVTYIAKSVNFTKMEARRAINICMVLVSVASFVLLVNGIFLIALGVIVMRNRRYRRLTDSVRRFKRMYAKSKQ